MPIIYCQLDLYLPYCHSLKEKRNVLRKATERVRSRFSFSVAEIEHQDLWQRARLGAVSIGADARRLEEMARKVIQDIEQSVGSDVTSSIEFIDID